MRNQLEKEWERFYHAEGADQKELEAMKQDSALLEYRFSKPMEFGTAGLRATMGMGLQAMNVYTVRHATQALANIVLQTGEAQRGVVIAWDSRHNSELFAKESAKVLAQANIPVYFFDGLRPTPVLSYAVRKLHCIAGINITASHNPKEYNGYKAYWEDGAQLAPKEASAVAAEMERIDLFDDVKFCDFDTALQQGKIKILPPSFDEEYIDCILKEASYPGKGKLDRNFSIVYTPLHGAGYCLVPKALRKAGFDRICTVEEQMIPDGAFPTTPYPNPEEGQVYELAKQYAEQVNADLLVATDPDADRIGVTLRRADGSYQRLTGNQVGALLAEYLLSAMEESNTMPPLPYLVTSIVSTAMLEPICRAHGAKAERVLTGFRFIGEAIRHHEEAGSGSFILAFEESYGYLKGTYARDKDAVAAAVMICEMAAYYRSKGMTLADAVDALFAKYGYYREQTVSLTMGVGKAGKEKMDQMMVAIRRELPTALAGEKVVSVRDYLAGTITDLTTGKVTDTGLERSDVMYFETEAQNVLVIRPSGTEPKVKVYYLLHGADKAAAEERLEAFRADTKTWME